jgi:hypothetical protein
VAAAPSLNRNREPERMKVLIASLLLSVSVPFAAHAADAQGRLNVHSMGVKSCDKVVADYDSEAGVAKLLNSVWVAGYLTAINSDVFDGFDVVHGMDAAGRDEWLYRYCRANPGHTLYHAAAAMVVAEGKPLE